MEGGEKKSSNSDSAGLFEGGQAHPKPEALSHALRARAGILLLINQRIFHEESESNGRSSGNGASKYTKNHPFHCRISTLLYPLVIIKIL